MNKVPAFYYKSYNWSVERDVLDVAFSFNAGNYSFAPKLTFKNVDPERASRLKGSIDKLVFHIGLIELLSYWKAFVTPRIVVECGDLDSYQKKWWKDLLLQGMGQFFYENNINFTKANFVEFQSLSDKNIKNKIYETYSQKVMVPVGGGKDSALTLSLIGASFKDVSAFSLNPQKAAIKVVKLSGLKSLIVERALDGKLIDLNKKGFPNGHTPFSALLSFVSLLAAVLKDFGTVIFSNERSSDEENTKFLGRKINHQYSKTLEFENKFRQYNQRYLTNINYFSFLRPLYDLQIAKIFSKMDKYHMAIRSCNVGQKQGIWCGKCPKCLSTYILFYPFLKSKTVDIFGKDLLKDASLKPILSLLTEPSLVKPFECVGTKNELVAAYSGVGIEKILEFWGVHNLPEKYEDLLKKEVFK